MIVKNRSKILIGLVVLVTLVASTILAFGVLNPTSTSQVQAADTIPVSEYYTPGSFPWGTAFDSQGRVWVALPGCDPTPSVLPALLRAKSPYLIPIQRVG